MYNLDFISTLKALGKSLNLTMNFQFSAAALFGVLFVSLQIVLSAGDDVLTTLDLGSLNNGSLSSIGLLEADDPRFAMAVSYDETSLPVTPVLMNAVEILAQYAEMDFLGRTRGRHGLVLDAYPQIEVAVLPAGAATSIEVRLVVWAIYGGIIEMIDKSKYKQCDIVFSWDGRTVGNVYFTKPLDGPPTVGNLTVDPAPPMTGNSSSLDANIGAFGWPPVYKPGAENVTPKGVFSTVLGTIKVIAANPIDRKVGGAFFVDSAFSNGHVEVMIQDRRTPRSRRPWFQYGHLLEALRRTPAWMLSNTRFAEMYASITSSGLPVGLLVLRNGIFDPGFRPGNGDVSVS